MWGLIWYPYRVLQDAGVSGAMATFITYLLAMICGAFMLPRVWRERTSFGGWALLLVLSAGWANFGYVLGMLHGEVMRVLLLFYLAPVWTILFSFWLLGERLNRYGYSCHCAVVGRSDGHAVGACDSACRCRRTFPSGWGFRRVSVSRFPTSSRAERLILAWKRSLSVCGWERPR